MQCKREWIRLYAVTDRSWLGGRTLAEAVEQALRGGVTMVQLREKHASDSELIALAKTLAPVCARYGAPLILNDRPELVAACGADGAHVGQSDMELRAARRLLGPDKLLGTSAHSAGEAEAAYRDGADYLGTGSVFATSTKSDASPLPRGTLAEICRAVPIPVAAIGGISEENLPQLAGSGVDGVAVVSAIFAQPDIEAAARRLRAAADRL